MSFNQKNKNEKLFSNFWPQPNQVEEHKSLLGKRCSITLKSGRELRGELFFSGWNEFVQEFQVTFGRCVSWVTEEELQTLKEV